MGRYPIPRLAAPLAGISVAVLSAYIANSPHLDRFGDSPTYELVANGLPRAFVSSGRMPGYPVLIALSSLAPGGREVGLIALQALLILAAVVSTYAIARLALGYGWIAFVVALVFATDLLIAGYVRVVMSETLAVFLASGTFIASLLYLKDFRPLYAWPAAALVTARMLTLPEWAFLPVVLIPYVLVMAWRRGRTERRMVTHAVASAAAVLIAVGAYCTANLAVNGYFGLSSLSNVALLGKVMFYGMAGDASGKFPELVPIVESSSSPWLLILAPPFDDRNSVLAGDFARAAILHHPLRFAQDVIGTAITTSGQTDPEFLRIHDGGAFARPLRLLLAADRTRYRAFVILPAIAMAWAAAAVIARRADYRVQALGLLGVIALYDWLLTAAGTFGEFERLRMPVNSIATVLVLGTFLLTLRVAFTDRTRRLPAVGLICLQAAAIGALPRLDSSIPLSEAALLLVAAIQAFAFVRWSGPIVGLRPEDSPL